MPMEGLVKFLSPQNTVGVSQEKGVAVTVEVNGDQVSTVKIMSKNKTINRLHTVCILMFYCSGDYCNTFLLGNACSVLWS